MYHMNMKTSPNDVSNQEIFHAIQKISEDVGSLKSDVGSLKTDVGSLKSELGSMSFDLGSLKESQATLIEAVQEFSSDTDARFRLMDSRLTRVESRMVTKDYLDAKLASLKSDLRQDTAKQIENALR